MAGSLLPPDVVKTAEAYLGPSQPSGDPCTHTYLTLGPLGSYMRCGITVPVVGGHNLLTCAWVQVPEEVLAYARRIRNDDEAYARLVIHGKLANALPGIGALGAEVTATVKDVSQLPVVEWSADAALRRAMREPQPYETVVPAGLRQ